MSARSWIVRLVASGLALGALGACRRPVDFVPPRNLVLVSLDTLRADHMGLYGYRRDTSPRLDAFARRGFVFERALAPAPNTPPSQMSLMTGLYPPQHGFVGRGTRAPTARPMLAEILHDAGFRTAGFVDGGFLSREFGFDRGFETFEDERGGFERILPAAERWVRAHREERFFLFLHTYDVHSPYRPPPGYKWTFHDRPYTGSFEPSSKNMTEVAFGGRVLSPADVEHVVARYDESIRYADDALGGFADFLEREMGLLEATCVIVTSDHGEEFGEHGSFLHWQTYYQPNLRIPLVIYLPGAGHPRRIAERVESIDVLPTVLDLLGVSPLPGAMGRSLVPLMRGDRDPPWSWLGRGGRDPQPALGWPPDPEGIGWVSVVARDHQLLIQPRGGGRRLFDLARDPMATRDVAAERPEVVAQLLESWKLRRPRDVAPDTEPVEVEESTQRQLEELGYLP